MQLERWWRRKIVQATGAGVVAPAAIIAAALAVGVGGGGIRGLGALGQTLTGPEVPTTAGVVHVGPGTDNLLARVNRSNRPSTLSEPASTGGTSVRRRASTRSRTRRQRATLRTRTRAPRPSAPSQPTPQPAPSQQPPPPPTPTPSAIRQLGDDIKEVTDPVPVVGPPAGQVIDTIVDTADEVIPPLPKLP